MGSAGVGACGHRGSDGMRPLSGSGRAGQTDQADDGGGYDRGSVMNKVSGKLTIFLKKYC